MGTLFLLRVFHQSSQHINDSVVLSVGAYCPVTDWGLLPELQ